MYLDFGEDSHCFSSRKSDRIFTASLLLPLPRLFNATHEDCGCISSHVLSKKRRSWLLLLWIEHANVLGEASYSVEFLELAMSKLPKGLLRMVV